MQVFQIRLKIYTLQDMHANQVQSKVASFIDKSLAQNPDLLLLHKENRYKNYCFDLPYPLEPDKVYKKGKIYSITIRTIDKRLAEYFHTVCGNMFTGFLKGLTTEIKIIPERMIDTVYTLTPGVMKYENRYWRDDLSLEEFENRLKSNLIKKWNAFEDARLNEDFELYTCLEFTNKVPIAIEYKNIKLLGDKIRLHIADNKTAQKLAYMALGTGILENNSRGAGFLGYRWM